MLYQLTVAAYPLMGVAVLLAAFVVGETRRRVATGKWR